MRDSVKEAVRKNKGKTSTQDATSPFSDLEDPPTTASGTLSELERQSVMMFYRFAAYCWAHFCRVD
jgi:hypothetical protein